MSQKDDHSKIAKSIIPVEIEDQMKDSYLAYAMSVIVGRALPDVRDGLKPVHRRILFAMNERAWRHSNPYVKSAKIVGEVIGNYHPHGDMAVYETMVRMAQNFSMRVPLIDGQGNFGSVDGDPPAAYRYTEARLTLMSEQMLADIDKETVDFLDNFDNTKKEPTVLPAAWPNLLVNGSSGIAVGMATKIPPHNLSEVIGALRLLIKDPKVTITQLMKKLPAPDFPTGGTIIGKDGIKKAYFKGKGSITIRSVADIEEIGRGREAIVVTEIPYEVRKNDLIQKIAKLVQDKKIEGISEIRDESDRKGMRILFILRKDANSSIVMNQLFERSNLQIKYGMNLLALVNNEPKLLNLKEILSHYLAHRKEIVVRRTQYLLKKAEERAHILEGLKIALDFIDEVIKIIRGSKDVQTARDALMKRFKLTEIQANAILDMRLQKLTSLESRKIIEELDELKKKIEEYKTLLGSEKKIFELIDSEFAEIDSKFGSKRKSEISGESENDLKFDEEDLIANEDVVITLTEGGYIKRVPIDTFKRQHRGGRGVISGGKKDDSIRHAHFCRSHDFVLLFSSRGKVFYFKAYEIPESTREAKGRHIKAIVSLMKDETITTIKSASDFSSDLYLLLLTRNGIIKKIALDQLQNAKKGGIIALSFKSKEDDYLIDVGVVTNQSDIFLASSKGLGFRTNLSKMRAQGRSASGIIGMNLSQGDFMIGLSVVNDIKKEELFIISENGYGKRIKFSEFSVKGRGGKGMTYLKVTEKNGLAVSVATVLSSAELIITTSKGMVIRSNVSDISLQGRSASGVKTVNLSEGDHVSAVTSFNLE